MHRWVSSWVSERQREQSGDRRVRRPCVAQETEAQGRVRTGLCKMSKCKCDCNASAATHIRWKHAGVYWQFGISQWVRQRAAGWWEILHLWTNTAPCFWSSSSSRDMSLGVCIWICIKMILSLLIVMPVKLNVGEVMLPLGLRSDLNHCLTFSHSPAQCRSAFCCLCQSVWMQHIEHRHSSKCLQKHCWHISLDHISFQHLHRRLMLRLILVLLISTVLVSGA